MRVLWTWWWALIVIIFVGVARGWAVLGGAVLWIDDLALTWRDHTVISSLLLLSGFVGTVDLDCLAAAVASLPLPLLGSDGFDSQFVHLDIIVYFVLVRLFTVVLSFTTKVVWTLFVAFVTLCLLSPLDRAYLLSRYLIYLLQLARYLPTNIDYWLNDIRKGKKWLVNIHGFVLACIGLFSLALSALLLGALVPGHHRIAKGIVQPCC